MSGGLEQSHTRDARCVLQFLVQRSQRQPFANRKFEISRIVPAQSVRNGQLVNIPENGTGSFVIYGNVE